MMQAAVPEADLEGFISPGRLTFVSCATSRLTEAEVPLVPDRTRGPNSIKGSGADWAAQPLSVQGGGAKSL